MSDRLAQAVQRGAEAALEAPGGAAGAAAGLAVSAALAIRSKDLQDGIAEYVDKRLGGRRVGKIAMRLIVLSAITAAVGLSAAAGDALHRAFTPPIVSHMPADDAVESFKTARLVVKHKQLWMASLKKQKTRGEMPWETATGTADLVNYDVLHAWYPSRKHFDIFVRSNVFDINANTQVFVPFVPDERILKLLNDWSISAPQRVFTITSSSQGVSSITHVGDDKFLRKIRIDTSGIDAKLIEDLRRLQAVSLSMGSARKRCEEGCCSKRNVGEAAVGTSHIIQTLEKFSIQNVHYLKLTNLGLTSLPERIAGCTRLRELSLRFNHIRSLPENLTDSLVRLDLKGNLNLTSLPSTGLAGLRRLDLSCTAFTDFQSLERFGRLAELHAQGLGLFEIPDVRRLARLVHLDLAYNNIYVHAFPTSTEAQCQDIQKRVPRSVTTLDLRHNVIATKMPKIHCEDIKTTVIINDPNVFTFTKAFV